MTKFRPSYAHRKDDHVRFDLGEAVDRALRRDGIRFEDDGPEVETIETPEEMGFADWCDLLVGSFRTAIRAERLGGWSFAFYQFWNCLTSPLWPQKT